MGSISFHIFSCFFEWLWVFKIEILAGLFAGLAIYAYFYKTLTTKESNLNQTINKIDNVITKLNRVEEKKSEVQIILDAVSGFSKEIRSFEKGVVDTMRIEMKELKVELKDWFQLEVSRINEDINELKIDVNIVKKNASEERLMVREQKNKLAWVISIAVFVSSLVIGVVQHFLFKAL